MYKKILELENKYGVCKEDLTYMALNIHGVDAGNLYPRVRMNFKLDKKDDMFYLGVPNKVNSCFKLRNNFVYLEDKKIGEVCNIENDDCASSYFRKNRKVITLNSNRRSTCTGCKFCPNNLEVDSEDININGIQELKVYLTNLIQQEGINDMSKIERITICTGCFESEEKLLAHIEALNVVLETLGFNGTLHYIGSQLKSAKSFEWISKNIKRFMITFTIECFSKRSEILRKTKSSISVNDYCDLMDICVDYGFITNYIYIAGIDPLETIETEMRKLFKHGNYFPIINIFQLHNGQDEKVLFNKCGDIEYYVKVRKIVEEIYKGCKLKPNSWECYRPLWYYQFCDEKLECIRI